MQRVVSPRGWGSRLSEIWDVGVIVLGSDQRVDFANRRAQLLLGAASDIELEQAWLTMHRELAPYFEQAVPGEPFPVEASVRARSSTEGSTLRIQLYLIEEDNCVGYLIILQPAERAAAVDASLRHAARNRSLGPLYRDLAHDLKGALNVIAMNVELLSRVSDGGAAKPELATRSALAARRELNRLDRMLEVVLDPNLAEREGPQIFDLGRLCQSLVELVAARASRQHVQIDLTGAAGAVDLEGFPDRIHAALLSLIVNALDAMPDGGTLTVAVEQSAAARISICDTGAGIEDEKIPEVWRLHYTTKAGGTGIGLYVTRTIVEAHRGRISYRPNPAGGSCFIVDLPLAARR